MRKLTLILILTASTAYCEIYTWTDIKGTTHYANSQYEIPERYRAKSKLLDLGIKENNPAQQNVPPEQNAPLPQSEQVQPIRPVQPQELQLPGRHLKREHQDRIMRHERPSVE